MRYTIVADVREPRRDYNTRGIALVEAGNQTEAKRVYKETIAPAVVKTFLEVYQSTATEIHLWDQLHGVDIQL